MVAPLERFSSPSRRAFFDLLAAVFPVCVVIFVSCGVRRRTVRRLYRRRPGTSGRRLTTRVRRLAHTRSQCPRSPVICGRRTGYRREFPLGRRTHGHAQQPHGQTAEVLAPENQVKVRNKQKPPFVQTAANDRFDEGFSTRANARGIGWD